MIPTIALTAAALAGDPPTFSGELRVAASSLTEFPTDAEGDTHGGEAWWDSRLRLGLSGDAGPVWIGLEGDVFSGLVAGDPYAAIDERSRAAFSAQGFVPRRASVVGRSPAMELELGLVPSSWGLGILANGGDQDPWFGRSDFGDRVIRARATTRAFGQDDLYFTLAGDRVLADDLARWSEGQEAWQGILSLLRVRPDARLGGYAVYRYQRELAADRTTLAGVADLYADRTWALGGGSLRLAAEVAGILGNTDRATTYGATDRVGIRSLGAAGLAHWTVEGGRWGAALRGAYASADGDPDDAVSRDFTFDRDYDVGMVLFDEVLGGIEASTYALLSDPENAGQAPDGVEAVVTEGAFRRAVAVQPIGEVAPLQWLRLRAGIALSWSVAPYVQPFYTYRSGGVPTNHHDLVSEGRALGTELDWSLQLGRSAPGEARVAPSLLIQGGHLVLGPPLQGAGPDRIDRFLVMTRLRW